MDELLRTNRHRSLRAGRLGGPHLVPKGSAPAVRARQPPPWYHAGNWNKVVIDCEVIIRKHVTFNVGKSCSTAFSMFYVGIGCAWKFGKLALSHLKKRSFFFTVLFLVLLRGTLIWVLNPKLKSRLCLSLSTVYVDHNTK